MQSTSFNSNVKNSVLFFPVSVVGFVEIAVLGHRVLDCLQDGTLITQFAIPVINKETRVSHVPFVIVLIGRMHIGKWFNARHAISKFFFIK